MPRELLDVPEKQGRLPIHIAAARGSLRAFNYILKQSSSEMLCRTDKDGWNALHWACRQEDKEVIADILSGVMRGPEGELLVRNLCGAKETLSGWQPRDLAIVHDNGRFLDLLDDAVGGEENLNGSEAAGSQLEIWDRMGASCDSCFTVSS